MTGTSRQARTLLLNALQQYSVAENEAEIEQAVLALHTGLDEAFRAYLTSLGLEEVGHRDIGFPDLVDLIRDHTDLFEGDPKLPALLVALNNTRIKIAHPRGDKPSPRQIVNDVQQLTRLIQRFWHGLFGEECPVSIVAPARKSETQKQSPVVSAPRAEPVNVGTNTQQPTPSSLGLNRFFSRLWKDENQPRFQIRLFLKRVIWIVILFALAKWCRDGAIYTARWPEPIKHVGLALTLLTVGLFFWGIVTIWKILRQLRLKGLLIILGVGYVLLLGVSILTSDSPLPFHQEAWLTTQQLIAAIGYEARNVAQTLVRAPGELHFAYTGHRRPVLLAGMDPEDSSYLTPIPANQPAKLSLSTVPTTVPARAPMETEKEGATPSPVPSKHVTGVAASPALENAFISTPIQTQDQPTAPPLRLPDCPHPQARLMTPKVNQVIEDKVEVMGTANIDNFAYYKFEFKSEDIEDEWHWVESFETPVEEGVLGTWDISNLPPGNYILRLTVVDRTGNYPFTPCEVSVYVAH